MHMRLTALLATWTMHCVGAIHSTGITVDVEFPRQRLQRAGIYFRGVE